MFDGEWWGHLALLVMAAGSVLIPGLVDTAVRGRRTGAGAERDPAGRELPHATRHVAPIE
jgi:hypothetical protein